LIITRNYNLYYVDNILVSYKYSDLFFNTINLKILSYDEFFIKELNYINSGNDYRLNNILLSLEREDEFQWVNYVISFDHGKEDMTINHFHRYSHNGGITETDTINESKFNSLTVNEKINLLKKYGFDLHEVYNKIKYYTNDTDMINVNNIIASHPIFKLSNLVKNI